MKTFRIKCKAEIDIAAENEDEAIKQLINRSEDINLWVDEFLVIELGENKNDEQKNEKSI